MDTFSLLTGLNLPPLSTPEPTPTRLPATPVPTVEATPEMTAVPVDMTEAPIEEITPETTPSN
ncbi:MAG: hypothetical protein CUN52_13130, partial [Phototrophicales bacterium]